MGFLMGIPVGSLVEFLVGKTFPPVHCPALPVCCPSPSPRCLLGSPVTMTGRMLALRSSWITGADSGFRTFFITRNPRKFRPLSTESLVGDKEPFITFNTSTEDQGAETVKIHQRGIASVWIRVEFPAEHPGKRERETGTDLGSCSASSKVATEPRTLQARARTRKPSVV